MEHGADVRRHRREQKTQDWATWSGGFKAGVEDREARRGPGKMVDGEFTWWYAAYVTGYLYGIDPNDCRRDLYDSAWQVWR